MRSASPKVRAVADLVVFHFAWFGIVWGGSHGGGWLVPVALAAQLAVHLGLSPAPWRELRWALVAGSLGWGLDTLLGAWGVLDFPGVLAPAWLWCLWLAFASTIQPGLAWFRRRLRAAALLGAVSGPFSYEVGVRLGALAWGLDRPLAWAILALVWAVVLPLMVRFSLVAGVDETRG